MGTLKLLSYNCRGLNDHVKRRRLLLWLKEQEVDVIFLQETFCTQKLEPFFKTDWNGSVFHCITNSSHSRGVAILFSEKFKGQVLNSFSSNDGRILLLNVQINDDIVTLVSAYAPNIEIEKIEFYLKLQNFIKSNSDNIQNLIVAGDFNACLKKTDRSPESAKMDKSDVAFEYMLKHTLLKDTWQIGKSSSPGFTYFDKKSRSYSRIDYILVSEKLLYDLNNVCITQPVKNTNVIDHMALKATYNCYTSKKGPGYWKLNNDILKDKNYADGVRHIIKCVQEEYKGFESHQLMWEILKVSLKEFSMKYCETHAKAKSDLVKLSQKKLDETNENIALLSAKQVLTSDDKNMLETFQVQKLELENNLGSYYNDKAKGHWVRSRTKWIEEGEVNSRYFLGLEKQIQETTSSGKLNVMILFM